MSSTLVNEELGDIKSSFFFFKGSEAVVDHSEAAADRRNGFVMVD
jgi:hypothetical protein